ncbi:MAG TPA: 1-acyl-sn-glycerol-3-phosphate acyltransferase [Alphaproteobacteria bacterium]|nr:1-acyl-sn-glycerol-3-phosphate acyltransferase [Alphaproteobacteria bacterium]
MSVRVPVLAPAVPRRGSRVMPALGRAVLALIGWRVEGNLPDLPKFIIIGAPHSSNWDFIAGMAVAFALDLKVTVLAKKQLFVGPLGAVMRFCGVVPVDRSAPHGLVGECVALLKGSERMVVGITPEGTRNPGPRWKMGFYHIALQSGVPIVPIGLDFGNRLLRIGAPLAASGDMDADMAVLGHFYIGMKGKRRTIQPAPFEPGAGDRPRGTPEDRLRA